MIVPSLQGSLLVLWSKIGYFHLELRSRGTKGIVYAFNMRHSEVRSIMEGHGPAFEGVCEVCLVYVYILSPSPLDYCFYAK